MREPIDKESSQEKGLAESREYIFHFFTAPSSYPRSPPSFSHLFTFLYRHRGNMIAMSKTRKRMGGRGHHPCRNERSLNRGPDNSVLIFRSLDFFFLPPFLSMVFYNVSNDRAREQFSRTRLNVNEKLLKKKEYICRKLGYY